VERPVIIDGQELSVGASIGIALFPEHGATSVTLMQHADVAMYVAKNASRSFAIYDAAQDSHSLRQLSISNELKNAIENNQLVLHYQPKIDLKNRVLSGVEALVRWRHPKHGLLSPDEFVPLAEQTGLIRSLTLWVLRNAIRECGQCMQNITDLRLSVNLSTKDLMDDQFADQIAEILADAKISSRRLKLEITETALVEDPDLAVQAMKRLNNMGLNLSIDDFGIGYSSLAYLKQLPVKELKIDKSFGLSLVNDGNSVVIVRSTIDMAHELGLNVVAEGVETSDAFKLLSNLGCDAIQGFYIAKPMPIEDMMQWMQNKNWELAVG
jgi:EAL domain-containing protein (putative c-di-GMP-specific phosphodiesterase class I)